MSLFPKSGVPIEIDVIGSVTKERYRGTFTVKVLMTNGEMLDMANSIDKLGGNSPTMPDGYKRFIESVIELDFTVLDAPKFWKDSRGGRDLMDPNVVAAVWEKANQASLDYKKKLASEAEEIEKANKEQEAKNAQTT